MDRETSFIGKVLGWDIFLVMLPTFMFQKIYNVFTIFKVFFFVSK